uniref:SHOCT domain-containing protein n=1 Tax=uncultured Lactobacillus sp. TaxID=153152 RepID=UPI002729B28B
AARIMAKKIQETQSNIIKVQNTNSSNTTYDELRELKRLLDDGIITEEEFTAKKKQILNI